MSANEKRPVIEVTGLKKQYKLGQIGGGTLTHDLQSWWARVRGKEDPNTVIGTDQRLFGQTFMALNGVDLTVYQGEALGIIGRNGAGKSTLLKLLMRFWDTDLGRVEISCENIKGINTASLRAAESFVEQDTVLFHDSIEENVKIANRNATHEQVVAACRKASIHDFIMTLPQGYDTRAGEAGERLSGGEKQLCILARTIAEDAPLLLLDEPDSALDLANRSRMTALLAQLVHTGGKTALVCLHDPALALDSCDILVVLQGGGVAAVLHPRTDPPAVLQAALAAVYGPLELLPVTDCRGRRRLALLPL